MVPRSSAARLIDDVRDGLKYFGDATQLAKELAGVLYGLANLEAVREQALRDYKAAKARRDRMKAKSDLAQVFEALTALADFATGLSGLMRAGRSVLKAARELRTARAGYKDARRMNVRVSGLADSAAERHSANEAGAEIGKGLIEGGTGAKDTAQGAAGMRGLGAVSDPGELLPDANAAAIQAAHRAFQGFGKEQAGFDMLVVHQDAESGGTAIAKALKELADLTRENKVLPESALEQLDALLSRAETSRARYQDAVVRLQQIWRAYEAGGSQALADSHNRGLFEKVAGWARSGDPKADSIGIALDQRVKSINFNGISVEESGGRVYTHARTAYRYEERTIQGDDGTLYVTDAAAERELKEEALLIPAPPPPFGQVGIAEERMDRYLGAKRKYRLSVSMCKALMSLGIGRTSSQDATVRFCKDGAYERAIREHHRTEAYEQWKDTPEFTEFWREVLGGEYGYIRKGDGGDLQTFAGATPEARRRSGDL